MTSLRARIVKALLVSLFVLFVVQWLLVTLAIRQVTENYAAARLVHEIETLVAGIRFGADGQPQLDSAHINQFYERPFSGHYFRIATPETVLTSRSLWDWPLEVPQPPPGQQRRVHATGPQSQPLLALAEGFRKQGFVFSVAVAEDLSQVNADIQRYQVAYAALSALFLLIMAAVAAWTVTRGLLPLRWARAELSALEQGRISALDERVPREIQPLVQEVNRLLRLTYQRLERSRKTAGNLAHGLKTPLTVLTRLTSDPALAPYESVRRTLAAQTARMRDLIERELKRARLAGGGSSAAQFVAAQELPALVMTLERLYEQRGIHIELRADPAHRFQADREDMLELFGNLLDNACKWAQHRVEVVIEDRPGLSVVISDDGPGVDDRQTRELLQRGARLDEAGEGHGLGLAIVGDIVRQYDGTLELARSPSLGGLQVKLWLPPPDPRTAA